jgi:hypothetical protein
MRRPEAKPKTFMPPSLVLPSVMNPLLNRNVPLESTLSPPRDPICLPIQAKLLLGIESVPLAIFSVPSSNPLAPATSTMSLAAFSA